MLPNQNDDGVAVKDNKDIMSQAHVILDLTFTNLYGIVKKEMSKKNG